MSHRRLSATALVLSCIASWSAVAPCYAQSSEDDDRAAPPLPESSGKPVPPPPAEIVLGPDEAEEGEAASPEPGAPATPVTSATSAEPSDYEAPPEPEPTRRAWILLTGAQDFTMVGRPDVCTVDGQNESYYCMRQSDGLQYIGTPVYGEGDEIAYRPRVSTTRVLGSLRVALGRFSLGTAVGAAVRGGGWQPNGGSPFLPLHFEGRGAFWFTGPAFAATLGVYVFGAGGIAQMDTEAQTWIQEDTSVPAPAEQPDKNDLQYRKVDVLQRAGRLFLAAGVGAFVPLGAEFGLVPEIRASYLFPAPAWALTPSLAAAYGF